VIFLALSKSFSDEATFISLNNLTSEVSETPFVKLPEKLTDKVLLSTTSTHETSAEVEDVVVIISSQVQEVCVKVVVSCAKAQLSAETIEVKLIIKAKLKTICFLLIIINLY
jgi:hypothetical protein